jgi:hypothetical protein
MSAYLYIDSQSVPWIIVLPTSAACARSRGRSLTLVPEAPYIFTTFPSHCKR